MQHPGVLVKRWDRDRRGEQVRSALVALDLISYGGVALVSAIRGVAALSK